ncbi:hypothetical protein NN561_013013 [Cricetulus griseus]
MFADPSASLLGLPRRSSRLFGASWWCISYWGSFRDRPNSQVLAGDRNNVWVIPTVDSPCFLWTSGTGLIWLTAFPLRLKAFYLCSPGLAFPIGLCLP